MSASYVIRSQHYSRNLDTGALVTLYAAGCGTLASTCQLFHVGMRALVINRCQCIVASLNNRVRAGTVDQRDVESLHHYWFRGLYLFRVEARLGRGREFGTSYGCYVERSLPSSGYVIPEQD